MRARALSLALVFAAWLAPGVAHAIDPDEIMANPALEARARAIGSQLRCLVCQNESIDESQAPLAKDIRGIVRQRLLAGATDAQIKSYLVARYGQFILLKPPFEPQTLLLWLAPLLCLGAGGLAAWRARRMAAGASDGPTPLSEAERLRLAALLGREDADKPAAGAS